MRHAFLIPACRVQTSSASLASKQNFTTLPPKPSHSESPTNSCVSQSGRLYTRLHSWCLRLPLCSPPSKGHKGLVSSAPSAIRAQASRALHIFQECSSVGQPCKKAQVPAAMELEGRPALMLKEWLELEFTAELSRDGFGCYPRHLVAELRTTRRNGDVIARVSAAVRAAVFRPSGREGEVALAGNFPRRLRVGFWKKRRGEEVVDRRAPSCSPSTTAGGRRDGSSPAMLPRRRNPERGQAGGVGAGAAGRRSNETKAAGLEATPHLEQEQERKQRLSPVSVMDFLSQDEDDDHGDEDENGDGDGADGDDETASPTFQRSIANIRRASQELLQKIRQFEQLGELDVSDVDDATTTTEDVSYSMLETDSIEDSDDASAQGILDLLEASSSGSSRCFQKLLIDFFRDDKTPRNLGRGKVLLENAQAWLDGQNCSLRPIWTVVKTEIASIEQWRCLREDEKNLLGADLETDIISSLIGELVDELY